MPPFYTYISSGAPSFTGLLDTYSGASAAYSFRRLSSAYTGNLITVRRDSDNTSIDVGYDPATNYLDTAAITTFCSGTDGYVSVWYDQSGNVNNLNQLSSIGQPKIYDSVLGIHLVNGNVAMYQSSTNELNLTTAITPASVFSVTKARLSGAINYLWYNYTTVRGLFIAGTSGSVAGFGIFDGSVKTSTLGENTNQNLGYFNYNGSNYVIDVNQAGSQSLAASTTFTVERLGRSTSSLSTNADIQEVIVYPTSQAANKLGIESNINSFYTIF